MKNSQVAKKILAYVGVAHEKIMIINTFTYGGYGKNKTEFTKSDYQQARKGTKEAENRLAPGNSAAESFFEAQEKHTSKNLKDIFPGQDMSSSVFATPSGGTHRIDKYPGSVLVGSEVYSENMTEAQKDRLIKEHDRSIVTNL